MEKQHIIRHVKDKLPGLHELIKQKGFQHIYDELSTDSNRLKRQQAIPNEWTWDTMMLLRSELYRRNDIKGYLILTLCCYLPFTITDIQKLRWEDIMGKETVMVNDTMEFHIHQNLKDTVEHAFNILPKSKYILSNRWGDPLGLSYINKYLKNIFKLYNIGTSPNTHTLRKLFGKRLYDVSGRTSSSLIYLSSLFSHNGTKFTLEYINENDISQTKNYETLM